MKIGVLMEMMKMTATQTEIPAAILERFESVRRTYSSRTKKINVLNYGRPGTGKTRALLTAPHPIHIDSFDQGGSRVLDDIVEKWPERFIIDSRWEVEDDFNPTAWTAWEKEYEEREKAGYFNYINTYVIDSATLWVEAALNKVRGNKKGPATLPEYNARQIIVRHALKTILNLPCNVVINAHPDYDKDEGTGKIIAGPIGGKMAVRFPPMFDEIYYSFTKETPKGMAYLWAVRPYDKGLYFARSRAMKGGDATVLTLPQDYSKVLRSVL